MSSGEYERDSSRRSPLDVFAGLFIILAGSLIFPSPALAFVPPSIIAPYSTYPPVTLLKKHPLRTTLWNSPGDDEAESGQDNMSVGEAEETILRINFSVPNDAGSLSLAAVNKYTQSFPFVAVLPVQPLTYLPVKLLDGNPAVKVTFLRKKTQEKGSEDGGIVFSSCLVSVEDYDEEGEFNSFKKTIELTAKRVTEGQTVSKVFSEKQIILAFVKGLNEERGKEILIEGGNIKVDSVFHLWM